MKKEQQAKKTIRKIFIRLFIPGFVLINFMGFAHAWRFTHFSIGQSAERTAKPDELSTIQKIGVLFTGVSIPKPQNEKPEVPYEEIWVPTQKEQEMNAWIFKADSAKGLVILFHGYAGHKSSLTPEALAFQKMGYHAVLVDFLGHGDSPGNSTSIGYGESFDVAAATKFFSEKFKNQPIYLFGFSMGAVAIIKSLSENKLPVEAAIICAPFSSMLKTVENRFTIMNLPSFPFAEILVFWGGVQHDFWAFGHNSDKYAQEIQIPVLLMHGEIDKRATVAEAKEVYESLSGPKDMKVFIGLAHQSYYLAKPEIWESEIQNFFENNSN